jgi:hypothetical protein
MRTEPRTLPMQGKHLTTDLHPKPSMNINAKYPPQILVNQVQQHSENIIYHDQMAFVPRMQGWLDI